MLGDSANNTTGNCIDLTVYKVVRVSQLKLLSLNCFDSGFCIEYVPGEVVKPKLEESKLFVYTDLYWAKRACYGSIHQVWRCSCSNLKSMPFVSIQTDAQSLRAFWNNMSHQQRHYLTTISPVNTHVCDSLVLIERVWPNENSLQSSVALEQECGISRNA